MESQVLQGRWRGSVTQSKYLGTWAKNNQSLMHGGAAKARQDGWWYEVLWANGQQIDSGQRTAIRQNLGLARKGHLYQAA